MTNPTPLSKQVVSLELAKKLKKLGVPQKSLFSYVYGKLMYKNNLNNTLMVKDGSEISAFTASELGEMLPWVIETNKNVDDDLQLEIQREGNIGLFMIAYHCYKGTNNCVQCLYKQNDIKLSDALAKMLIYLYQQGAYEI